jgi:hypothetical protein
MNGTTLERPDVAAYLDAVRSRLADLPSDERDDLVADVEASLLEAGEPPTLSPEEFAAELREAAGLTPEPARAGSPSLLDSLRSWLSSERAASWRTTARELAPIWWLSRAYVAIAVLALAVGWGWPVGSGTSGNSISFGQSVVALLVVVAISIWLGLRGRRTPSRYRRLAVVANVALALAFVPVAAHSLDQLSSRSYGPEVVYAEPVSGLALDGVQIRNLYPYSREGTLLLDVLLYDQFGRPVEITSGPDDTFRRVLADGSGETVFNSYPIRYFDPGTKTVARPRLTPPIAVPEIVTPPLSGSQR